MSETARDAEPSELGLDTRVTQSSDVRLLNRDGAFNVSREGLPFFQSLHVYHALFTMPWWKFNLLLVVTFVLANTVFCLIYLGIGQDAIVGQPGAPSSPAVLQAIYLSVATMTTVGYGNLVPNGITANAVASIEAFLGLFGFAVLAGLIFARVARPTATVRFSNVATIATGLRGPTFKFRIVNAGRNELIDADVRVLVVMTEDIKGARVRRFHDLPIERNRVAFFPLDWTVVHYIGEDSPLRNLTTTTLESAKAEFLVLINATDDTAGQAVHARSSYRWNEVVWDRQFVEMFRRKPDGRLAVDLRRLNDVVESGTPTSNETLWDMELR